MWNLGTKRFPFSLAVLLSLSRFECSVQAATNADEAAMMEPVVAAPPQTDHILGVIPNYLVIEDTGRPVPALTTGQKFKLFVRETTDPFTFVSAGLAAGLSQSGNNTPRYGVGAGPYGQRLGAAYTDVATTNFFSDAVFASLFHQDPRYYRMGPGHSVARRAAYSLSRLFITRQDNGSTAFNISAVLGIGTAVGLSNAYYPSCNVNGSTAASHLAGSVIGASFGNLLPEFWPDLKEKFARRRHAN